ncbi:DUF6362 family protein [Brucella anthropi]|uniref:DUF6362 family protein n=1 Tax=Brucella anthropi TaxID=529 RepID=UPI00124F33CA|nr:DUF6362 family protein [Brucella anthropi]KAB2728241.1 hypothetical protein F9K76_01970 [Brucella anthropi]KAB2745413.1 hypothetical protein F9K74_01920 [Brucella anthropi]KAB2805837.1 hypothetical protein F9K83_01920 [Brucella anthropi]
MKMTLSEMTAADMEARVIEAAATEGLLPRVNGPKSGGNSMPDVVREWSSYASEPSRYIRRPKPDAIDRMMETVCWINDTLPEDERLFLYKWAKAKVTKGVKLNDFAKKNDINNRTMRRYIRFLCQRVIDGASRLERFRLTEAVDPVSENDDNSHQQTVSSEKCATHWRAPDAKPKNIPSLHEKMKPAA